MQDFFKDQKVIPPASANPPPAKLPIDAFQLPVSQDLQPLTKSHRIFSIATRTDVRSLTIFGDIEFFLFMKMRAEWKWASFMMTSHKWVSETAEFNARLLVPEGPTPQMRQGLLTKKPRFNKRFRMPTQW